MGIAVLRLVARRRRPDKRHPSYEGLYKATPESRALIQDRGTITDGPASISSHLGRRG